MQIQHTKGFRGTRKNHRYLTVGKKCGEMYTLRHTCVILRKVNKYVAIFFILQCGTMYTLCHTYEKKKRDTKPKKGEVKMMKDEMLHYISKQLAVAISMLEKQQREPTNKIGRPTKGHIVLGYRESYPESSRRGCARATGLSIKTVSKYWNQYDEALAEKEAKSTGIKGKNAKCS